MPTLDWLRNEFGYGYSSGRIDSLIPSARRWYEERRSGGSYRRVFREGVRPHLRTDSEVLELGPGRGSWSRAILRQLPRGRLEVIDFQDVRPWLKPAKYGGRLVCHQVRDNSLGCLSPNTFDFFWSFGVLCHNNLGTIREILKNAAPKMKPGGVAVHQYADWDKLNAFGWERGTIPVQFRDQPDDEIWWPRNSKAQMVAVAEEAGWTVLAADLGLLDRDGLIMLGRSS